MALVGTPPVARERSVLEAIFRPERVLRISLGVVYLWFGALKVVGMSPVVELMRAAHPLLATLPVYVALAAFEVVLGLVLLVGVWTRVAAAAAALHLFGTFAVVLSSPRLAFQPWFPFLTMEGEFVVKNLVLLAASAALWSLSPRSLRAPAPLPVPRLATVALVAASLLGSAGLGISVHRSLRATAERAAGAQGRAVIGLSTAASTAADDDRLMLDGVIAARCPLLGCWITLRRADAELFIDLAPHGLTARHLPIGSPVRVEAEIGKTRGGTVGLVAVRLEAAGL